MGVKLKENNNDEFEDIEGDGGTERVPRKFVNFRVVHIRIRAPRTHTHTRIHTHVRWRRSGEAFHRECRGRGREGITTSTTLRVAGFSGVA